MNNDKNSGVNNNRSLFDCHKNQLGINYHSFVNFIKSITLCIAPLVWMKTYYRIIVLWIQWPFLKKNNLKKIETLHSDFPFNFSL